MMSEPTPREALRDKIAFLVRAAYEQGVFEADEQAYEAMDESAQGYRLPPKQVEKEIEQRINAEVLAVLNELESHKQTVPVHGGTDSHYPKEYIEAVPLSAITQLKQRYGGKEQENG